MVVVRGAVAGVDGDVDEVLAGGEAQRRTYQASGGGTGERSGLVAGQIRVRSPAVDAARCDDADAEDEVVERARRVGGDLEDDRLAAAKVIALRSFVIEQSSSPNLCLTRSPPLR